LEHNWLVKLHLEIRGRVSAFQPVEEEALKCWLDLGDEKSVEGGVVDGVGELGEGSVQVEFVGGEGLELDWVAEEVGRRWVIWEIV
jgi:hypothetical protein